MISRERRLLHLAGAGWGGFCACYTRPAPIASSAMLDPKFLEEISRMKERNFAVELLRKLIAE